MSIHGFGSTSVKNTFFSYTTSNGITREENAVLIKDVNSKDEDQILRINGFYSYTDEANIVHRVDYIADENGYKILERPLFVSAGFADTKEISTDALASLAGWWGIEDRLYS